MGEAILVWIMYDRKHHFVKEIEERDAINFNVPLHLVDTGGPKGEGSGDRIYAQPSVPRKSMF
jgi:hypothetical protein